MRMFFQLSGAVAAVGSALIVIAVGAGSPLWLALILIPAGIAQAVVGVAAFQEQAWVARPAGISVLMLPLGVWLGSLVLGDVGVPFLPMLAGVLLGAGAAVSLSVASRRPTPTEETERAGAFISALLVASAVVAGVVTPALSGTNAGAYAVPHGEHGLDLTEHGH